MANILKSVEGGAHGLGRRELVGLWRRVKIVGDAGERAAGCGDLAPGDRVTLATADVRKVIGDGLSPADVVRLGAEACARLLASARPGKTLLHVLPEAMRVFVGEGHAFAEARAGERYVFRKRERLHEWVDRGVAVAAVELWEEDEGRAAPTPTRAAHDGLTAHGGPAASRPPQEAAAEIGADASEHSRGGQGADPEPAAAAAVEGTEADDQAPAPEPTLQARTCHVLQFAPNNGIAGDYLLEQLKDDMSEDGRYIHVGPGVDLALPPGDYHVFHEGYRTVGEGEESQEVAELFLEPSPPDQTPAEEVVSLGQLTYTLQRVAGEYEEDH